MAELQTLRAEPRPSLGKGASFRVKTQGFIPGIVYGGAEAPQPVQVEARGFVKLHSTGTLLSTLFMLDVEGTKIRVIPRDVQLDPVTDRPIHVDFMRLTEGARIALHIPVHFRGQESSPGIKRGGVLNIVRHTIELKCPVDNIPASIDVDLSSFDIGDSLHISAIALPEGVTPVIQGRDFTIATLAPPTTYTEEAPKAAAEGAAAEGAAEGAAAAGDKAAAVKAAAGDKAKPAAKK